MSIIHVSRGGVVQVLAASEERTLNYRSSRTVSMLLMAVLLAALNSASAQQKGTPDANAKPAVSAAPQGDKDVESLSCGDVLFMFGDDTKIQDSTYLVLWAYGFKAGMQKGDLKANPLTPAGLKHFVGDIYDLCKVNSDTKFVDALRNAAAGK